MKITIFFTLIILITLNSCRKIIDIDLNSSNPQFVIEGIVSNKSTLQTVTITKTLNFSDVTSFPKVSNAVVTISDNNAAPITLNLTTAGVYQTTSIIPTPGHTYELKVIVDGKTFIAKSTMPQPVILDSLNFLLQQSFGPATDTNYAVIPKYMDPASFVNFYKLTQTVNSNKDITIFPFNDNLNNGNVNKRPLFSNNDDYKMLVGDTVTVELNSIDKNVYDYFVALSNIVATSGGPTTTPANPTSNFSGGALGYFSAQTHYAVTKIVTP